MVMSINPKPNKEGCTPATEMSTKQSFSGIALESVSRMFCPTCKQKIDTSTDQALSEGKCPSCDGKIIVQGKVGPYRVLKLIGQGGMGAVYEGFDDGLGRKVAIKVTLMDVTRDRNMMETFQREAQVVAKLNHPNVVQVYAFGVENGHPYLVMELLSSGSLLERIEGEDPLDSPFLMGVAMEVAEGLNAAQEAGLLHGDIKPENILFDDKMHAKLVDFGLAAMSSSVTKGEVWGTPYYIAPEKVTERKSNHKCDIYSLGATLYHAYTKQPPFDGIDGTAVVKACIEEQATPLSEKRPDIEPEVAAIISRMMEKDVFRRYPNYKSILTDIKKFLITVPVARLSRTSRIVTHGKKKSAGTKKILLKSPAGKAPSVGVEQPQIPVEAKSSRAFPKKLVATMVLFVCVVILGIGGCVVKMRSAGKTQQQLSAQVDQVDADYFKVLAFVRDGYLKIEKIDGEAQKIVNVVQQNSSKNQKRNAELIKQAEDIKALGVKVKALLRDAEVVRNRAEQGKPEPSTTEAVDLKQVTLRQKELSAVLESSKTIKVKGEEAEGLFSELQKKSGAPAIAMKNAPATTAQAAPAPAQAQDEKRELAKGSGNNKTSVDLSKQKGLREFKLNAGESLVLAVWKSSPNEKGGGVINKLQLARKGGGKVDFKGEPLNTEAGTFSLKGLAKRDKFPSIIRMMDALPGPRSGDYVLNSVQGVQFDSAKDNGLYLVSSSRTNSDSEYGWAPAVVFTAKQAGVYSASGTIALQTEKPQMTVSWMVWVCTLKY